jgi:branched-subunit amino acid transport protein
MTDTRLWWMIAALSATAFGFKALGFVALGGRRLPVVVERCLALIPAALLAALVVKDTVTIGQDVVLDERIVGVAVAAFATWRKMPFLVVIVAAMATTAAIRYGIGS